MINDSQETDLFHVHAPMGCLRRFEASGNAVMACLYHIAFGLFGDARWARVGPQSG